MTRVKIILFAAFLVRAASAQFTPALMRENSYWGDGKAEFSIYGAEIMRAGIPRKCEVLHILSRDQLDSVSCSEAEPNPNHSDRTDHAAADAFELLAGGQRAADEIFPNE